MDKQKARCADGRTEPHRQSLTLSEAGMWKREVRFAKVFVFRRLPYHGLSLWLLSNSRIKMTHRGGLAQRWQVGFPSTASSSWLVVTAYDTFLRGIQKQFPNLVENFRWLTVAAVGVEWQELVAHIRCFPSLIWSDSLTLEEAEQWSDYQGSQSYIGRGRSRTVFPDSWYDVLPIQQTGLDFGRQIYYWARTQGPGINFVYMSAPYFWWLIIQFINANYFMYFIKISHKSWKCE